MAEIFISYAREDIGTARRLAAALEERGWSVFWDRRIPAGRRFAEVIAQQLEAAKCVIALWSTAGNTSDWVLEEAEDGKMRGILAPALIEAVEPPRGFRRIHAADLIGWSGDGTHEGFRQLLEDIAHYVPVSPVVPPPEQTDSEPGAEKAETPRPPGGGTAQTRPTGMIGPHALLRWHSDRYWSIGVVALLIAAGVGWLIFTQPTPPMVESEAKPGEVRIDNEVRINPIDGQPYVWIPQGEFQMGCSPRDDQCSDHEKPSHTVRITRGFWLGQTPVTQAAYEKVMGENPSYFKGPQHPVETVRWDGARKYCEAVGGRLPTEAEWEYAARAGSAEPRYGVLDAIAWHTGNSGRGTRPVKQRQPNSWGLHDMLGNVWEWVGDWYGGNYYQTLPSPAVDPKGPSSGTYRVMRGGSWYYYPRNVRASERSWSMPGNRDYNIGFRCVREIIP
jgi:formylglycine-generating enzyme required for sulfatase activity